MNDIRTETEDRPLAQTDDARNVQLAMAIEGQTTSCSRPTTVTFDSHFEGNAVRSLRWHHYKLPGAINRTSVPRLNRQEFRFAVSFETDAAKVTAIA
jgi:hypothetical protein